jgi:protoporphyrinogen oxidase
MAKRVGEIELGTAIRAVDFRAKRVRVPGRWVPYSALVATLPLDRLAAQLVDPPRRIEKAAQALRCAPLRYLDVALARRPGVDHHWSYVPERRYPFYRVGSYSSFSAGMAPRGKGSLYVELASRRPVRLDRLMPRVVSGLLEMGIIARESDIAFVRPRRIRHAYVIYDRHWARSRSLLIEWLERHDIFTAGRYARWESPGDRGGSTGQESVIYRVVVVEY